MKTKLSIHLFVACLSLTLVSCTTSKSVVKLQGGYEEVDLTWQHLSEPPSGRTELYYRDPNGKRTMIWKSVFGRVIVKGDKAFFTGLPISDLFAVEGPGPALLITGDILRTSSQINSSTEFARARWQASIAEKREVSDGLEIHFVFGGRPIH